MILILMDFTGYPGGVKRAFRAGEAVRDLAADDAALYVAKELAAFAKAVVKAEKAETRP